MRSVVVISFVCIALAVSTAVSVGATSTSFVIAKGIAAIDGVISPGEWDAANALWHDMDQVYAGNPADLSDATYAAMWSDTTNLVYVVVTGVDIDHVFNSAHPGPPAGYDKQDAVEVYLDAANSDANDWASTGYDYAQQYVGSMDGSGGDWIVMGNGTVLPAGVPVAFAGRIDSDVLTYEMALTPYAYFTGLGGSAETQSVRTLAVGDVIGLDVCMDSRQTDGTFGMLCNNLDGGKYNDAAVFQDHELVEQGPQPACGDALHAYPRADITEDCIVNILDFGVLATNWLADSN